MEKKSPGDDLSTICQGVVLVTKLKMQIWSCLSKLYGTLEENISSQKIAKFSIYNL